MPSYAFITGYSPGWTGGIATRYWGIIGDCDYAATYPPAAILIRDSYTLRNLYVRVTAHGAGITTVASQINAGVGTLLISIGAGLTGAFRDIVNSDALVTGDVVSWKIINAADIDFTVMGAEVVTAINTTFILACTYPLGQGINDSLTAYIPICGFFDVLNPTESVTQYIFRVASALTNFRVYITTNTLDSATTARIRVNGANGQNSVTIGAGLTGSFEDAGNTDNIAIGNLVNFQLITGGSGTQKIYPSIFQVKADSAGQQIGIGSNQPWAVNDNLTQYYTIQGNSKATGAEGDTQILAQFAFTAQNMFVRLKTNTVNGVSTLKMRKNGADGNLGVSIGAATSGTFEDTTNSDAFIATDLLNWQLITGGDAGSLNPSIIAFELEQPAAPPTGIQDKSAHMASKLVAAGVI